MNKILLILTIASSTVTFAANGTFTCAYQAKYIVPAISKSQIIELCHGANDSSPVDCLYEVTTNPLLKFDIESGVKLCKPALFQGK